MLSLVGGKAPTTGKVTNMASKQDDKFVIVDADSIQYVKRGRKASVDSELVEALRRLPVGKAMALVTLKQDPAAASYGNDKSRVASSIRTACKSAGLTGFRILWSPQGVPQVVR